jgi:hypothetical protein
MEQDEVLEQGYDARLLRRLLVYLRPYRGLTALAVLLLLAGASLALVGPALTQRALSRPATRGCLPRWPRCSWPPWSSSSRWSMARPC